MAKEGRNKRILAHTGKEDPKPREMNRENAVFAKKFPEYFCLWAK